MLNFKPSSVGELMLPNTTTYQTITAFILSGRSTGDLVLPSMILEGPPGYGKSAAAEVILTEACGIAHPSDLLVINAGMGGSVADLTKAVNFGGTWSISSPRKGILIDEVDRFSGSAKADLKGALDRLKTYGVPVVMTTNDLSGVSHAVQSRSQVIYWSAPTLPQLVARAQQVLQANGKMVTSAQLTTMAQTAGRDARRFFEEIQKAVLLGLI